MSVCDVPLISSVCDAVGDGVASLVSAPFDFLASALAGAAAWMFEAVWTVFDQTTLVDVTGGEYVSVYNIIFGIAVFLMLIFFSMQLITGLVHRDPGALSKAALGLGKSVLGSFLVITLTALLLEITDQLAIGIVQATGNDMASTGTQIGLLATALAGVNIGAPGVGAIITIFLAGLAVSAAAVVWFSLLIRKALLLVAVAFGPVAMAGATWSATKGWITKWVSFVLALILSKLVLVVIFLVAIAQVSQPIELDLASISDPIAGVVLMFIASFAPYITYKFLSFVGVDMYHAMSSEQEAKQALNRPVPIPNAPKGDGAKKVLDGADPGGGSGGGGSAGGPPPPPPPGGGAPAAAAAPAAGGGGAAAGAGAGGAGAGAGAGGAGAAGAGAAAAGPAAAVVVGAAVVKGAAEAGPKAGKAVGGAAEGQAAAASEASNPPPTPPVQPSTPPPAVPPSAPPSSSGPAPSSPPPSTPRRSDPPPPPTPAPSGKE
jgi:hypothetical protein